MTTRTRAKALRLPGPLPGGLCPPDPRAVTAEDRRFAPNSHACSPWLAEPSSGCSGAFSASAPGRWQGVAPDLWTPLPSQAALQTREPFGMLGNLGKVAPKLLKISPKQDNSPSETHRRLPTLPHHLSWQSSEAPSPRGASAIFAAVNTQVCFSAV